MTGRPSYAEGLTENLPDLGLDEFPNPPHRKADLCGYFHKGVDMYCGGTREAHAARYQDHEFVEPQPPPRRKLSLSEEQQELQRDATSLAYTAIRFCPELRDKLSEAEWDAKSAVYGWLVVELLNKLIDEDLTEIEKGER